ncbi:CAP domain-containing protein [Streptomyces lunalinharesii]|uniref:SCP domain-containing protein n=1 Tax=Streptomyces lunalinharesii TaxID=333384 RepID=A0ABP6F187_9ACTN
MTTLLDWRSCYKCQTLFFDMLPEKGDCPAGGGHKAWGFAYGFSSDATESPTQQINWRQCGKCYALYFDGFLDNKGVCPTGGGHQASGYMCAVLHDGSVETPTRQTNWRSCGKCQAMFFDGFPEKGACATGGGHQASGWTYVIDHWTDEPQDSMDWQEIETFDLVNSLRRQAGAEDVRIDPRLVAETRAHSQDLADHFGLKDQVWNGWPGHVGSDGSTPPDRITKAVGVSGFENVYSGWFSGNGAVPSPQDACNWWMGEPGHRANLLDPHHANAGMGIAYGPGVTRDGVPATWFYFTQDFTDAG